jgi:hypothetical protein
MAITMNEPLRNAILDGINTFVDAGLLRIYSGSKPATANLAPTGTLLASITLPADAFAAASAGAIAKAGTWSDPSANDTGTAGYFRISETGDDDSLDGDFHRIDGTVTATGGGGDLTLDSVSIAALQAVTVNTFTITMPAA